MELQDQCGGSKSNDISAMKNHLFDHPAQPVSIASTTSSISINKSIWSDISPSNSTKGRIWVPKGASVNLENFNPYGPKNTVFYRWNAPPEHVTEALQEMDSSSRDDYISKSYTNGF